MTDHTFIFDIFSKLSHEQLLSLLPYSHGRLLFPGVLHNYMLTMDSQNKHGAMSDTLIRDIKLECNDKLIFSINIRCLEGIYYNILRDSTVINTCTVHDEDELLLFMLSFSPDQ